MPSPLKAPGPRYGALLQILRTAEVLWESSRVFFARWDLSTSQFNILNLLRDHPDGASQTKLSRELIMHRSNVTGLVDRLEKRRLVKRTNDPADRRVHRVKLTREGRAILQKVLPDYYAAAETVLGGMSPAQAKRLAGSLDEISQQAHTAANQSKSKR